MTKFKTLLVMWVLVLCGVLGASAQTSFDLFSQATTQIALVPTNAGGGTIYGDPIDVGPFGGVVDIVIMGSSNGVAGDVTYAIVAATAPTNVAGNWAPISNACFAQFSQVFRTNLLISSAGKTTNVVNTIKDGYTNRATYTSTSNEVVVIGIPARDNARYWRVCATNASSSIRNIGALLIGRNMQTD